MSVPAPTSVFFVRHAESQSNLDKDEIAHGWRDAYPRSLQDERDADVRLTARGVEQARATGRYLAANLGAFDACYVSPWLRTRHTFDHLLAATPRSSATRCARRRATRSGCATTSRASSPA
jgi:broad specificity phosphatase PhoE